MWKVEEDGQQMLIGGIPIHDGSILSWPVDHLHQGPSLTKASRSLAANYVRLWYVRGKISRGHVGRRVCVPTFLGDIPIATSALVLRTFCLISI